MQADASVTDLPQSYNQPTVSYPPQQNVQMANAPFQTPTASVTNVNIITTQPQPGGLMVTPLLGHRTWTTGICDCCSNVGTCVMVAFCMPCMECRNASRLGECCCTPYCCQGGSVALRARLRTIGGISGSIADDACTLMCCGPCAVCQMSREMDNMGIP